MPRRRRIEKAKPHAEISDAVWAYLNDLPIPDGDSETKFAIILLEAGDGEALRELWGRARAEVLGPWLKDHPGTRPSIWWRFDAPRQLLGTFGGCFYDGKLQQPRKQISGAGCDASAISAYMPSYESGLPRAWAGFEEADPPTFESQAAYLRRFNLLTAGEKKVLQTADYEQTEALPVACAVDLGPFEGPDAEGVRWLNQWGASIRERIPAARKVKGLQ